MKKTTLFSLALASGMAILPSLVNAQAKVTLTTSKEVGSEISFVTNPGTISVDWGDGNVVDVLSDGEAIKGTLKGTSVIISANNLSFLDCSSNELVTLTVTDAADLKTLYCSNNSLKSLVLGSRNVEYLDCSDNEMSSLSLVLYPNLKFLNCAGNNLMSLSLTQQGNLETLICSDNKLSALVTSKATGLKTLWCQNNTLKSLDLSANRQLESLVCDNNNLTNLNVSNCTGLVDFWCDSNQLESINVHSNVKLETFSCSNNQISALTVPALSSADKALAFYCDGNNLTFSSMHSPSNILNEKNIWFSPQGAFNLPVSQIKVGESVTIEGMDTNLDGDYVYPDYQWTDGETYLEKGSSADYTAKKNKFTFKKAFDEIYCEITSSVYPGLTLKSTPLAVLSEETGIQDVMDAYGFSYKTNNGAITMRSEKPYRVNIYSIDGKLVWSGFVVNEEQVSLGHGVFLVNGVKISL